MEFSPGWSSIVPEYWSRLKICGPLIRYSVFGIPSRPTQPDLLNRVNCSIYFFSKSSRIAKSKHEAKAEVFFTELSQATLPIFPSNNDGSLFDLFQDSQTEECICDQNNMSTLSSLWLVTCVFFVSYVDVFPFHDFTFRFWILLKAAWLIASDYYA